LARFFKKRFGFLAHLFKKRRMDQADSVVQAVIAKFLERAALGKAKYGTTLDRTDLKTIDWIRHAQEELMDGILYLEKLKQSFPESPSETPKTT